MSAPTFVQVLKSEVAKFQALHPEREGEIARAHALILHGQVLPSADDPQIGQVLSSDGEKRYTVNGSCDCQAGQHGKGCKHMQAWKLYQYISKKIEAEAQPTPALPEARCSLNVRLTIAGREVQWTLRDHDEARLAVRLDALLARYPVPPPPAQPQGQLSAQQYNALAQHQKVTGVCPVHQVAMQENHKDGRSWWSHKTQDGWCKGK